MKKALILIASHVAAVAVGFVLGIYVLPILTAPPAPSATEIASQTNNAVYSGQFRRELKDSDLFHWGEGTVSVNQQRIALLGRLAPGPDYKLYLSPEFVETKADFVRLKARMIRVGDVKTFENFVVPVPESVDLSRYNTVIVWCESFSQFIPPPSIVRRRNPSRQTLGPDNIYLRLSACRHCFRNSMRLD